MAAGRHARAAAAARPRHDRRGARSPDLARRRGVHRHRRVLRGGRHADTRRRGELARLPIRAAERGPPPGRYPAARAVAERERRPRPPHPDAGRHRARRHARPRSPADSSTSATATGWSARSRSRPASRSRPPSRSRRRTTRCRRATASGSCWRAPTSPGRCPTPRRARASPCTTARPPPSSCCRSRASRPGRRIGAPVRALRDIRFDLANRAETYVTTNLPGVWGFVQRRPALHRKVNAALVNRAILKIPTRPNPYSTLADYTSWASLTDRTYDSRHLPAREGPGDGLPPAEVVASLFNRQGEGTPCEKSTVLFPYFAEWFVDGFLRSERPHPGPDGEPVRDPARNESNHEIDLIQIYGLNAARHGAAAHARGRTAAVADAQRRGVPAVPLRGRAQAIRPGDRRPRRADQRRPAPPAVRVRQRHRQPPARLRADGRAVPARAQPHRALARAASTRPGTTSGSSRPRATSSR